MTLRSFAPIILATALASTACSSGTVRIVQAPPPVVPARRPPLEVSIVRPDGGRLLLQTNRAAYVALFEIVPGRGTALVYPATNRQRSVLLSGLSWVQVWWTMPPASDRRIYSATGQPERYVYAIASDRPLRISDYSYDAAYLQRVLGFDAYRATNPTATVRAISRQFIPVVPDEQWGEDLYAFAPPTVRDTYRIARVYCSDGTVYEVREDMAHRAWCPPRRGRPRDGIGGAPGADAPDSVLGSTGRPVARRPFDPSDRQPPFRVPTPPVTQPPTPTDVGQGRDRDDRDKDRDRDKDKDRDKDRDKDKDKDHDDNGRRSHGDPRNADPRGRGVGAGSGNGGDTRDRPNTQPGDQGRGNTGAPRSEPQPLPELKLQGEPKSGPGDNKPDKPAKPDVEEKAQKRDEPPPPPPSSPPPAVKHDEPDPPPAAKQEPKRDDKPSSLDALIKKRGPKQDKKADSTAGKP